MRGPFQLGMLLSTTWRSTRLPFPGISSPFFPFPWPWFNSLLILGSVPKAINWGFYLHDEVGTIKSMDKNTVEMPWKYTRQPGVTWEQGHRFPLNSGVCIQGRMISRRFGWEDEEEELVQLGMSAGRLGEAGGYKVRALIPPCSFAQGSSWHWESRCWRIHRKGKPGRNRRWL